MPTSELEVRLRVVRVGSRVTLALAAAGILYAMLTWEQPHRAVFVVAAAFTFLDGIAMHRIPVERFFLRGQADALMIGWNVSHALLIGGLCALDGALDSPFVAVFFIGVVFASLDQRRVAVLAIAALDVATLVAVATIVGDWDGRTAFLTTSLMTLGVLCSFIAGDREARLLALEEAKVEVVHRLARVVEHRDTDTGEHIERMSTICAIVARGLGWGDGACAELQLASTMHDVGKVAVPDAILLKPGPLDAGERALMETHARVGHDMLADSPSPVIQLAARIALTHHERYDGTGYPQGLAGPDIPVEGRIVAVADVYDALTSDRVYRPAMPVSEALAILEAGRGTHFDPLVLDAFLAGLPGIVALGGGAAPAAEVPMPRLALAGAGVA